MSPEYAEKISRAYLEKVGRGLVLSPKDYQYIQKWALAGIPCELVLVAIETAFAKAPVSKVRSIGYISGPLKEVVRQWRKMRVGENELDPPVVHSRVLEPIKEMVRSAMDGHDDSEIVALFQGLVLDLDRLSGHIQSDEDFDVHGALESLEHAFLDRVFFVLPSLEKAEIIAAVERRMASDEAASAAVQADIRTALTRRRTREYLGLSPLELDSGRGW